MPAGWKATAGEGEEPMPVTVGWHPWLRRHVGGAAAALHLPAERMWRRDAEGIPDGTLVEPTTGTWDDCFTALVGPVEVRWPDVLALRIESDCEHLVVFDEPAYALCVEPQSAPPDAHNSEQDLAVVEPGSSQIAGADDTVLPVGCATQEGVHVPDPAGPGLAAGPPRPSCGSRRRVHSPPAACPRAPGRHRAALPSGGGGTAALPGDSDGGEGRRAATAARRRRQRSPSSGWVRRIVAWRAVGRDVYAYFDNDVKSAAPLDALELKRRLGATA